MSVSAIVPEKSRGNNKCDKEQNAEEEERHIFALLAATWLYATLDIYRPMFNQSSLVLSKMGPNRYT